MQVRIEDVSPIEKKLIVEVPWARVNDLLGDTYRKLSKSVQLKGFRKGKVPRSVLQRIYGKHVHAEVAEQLIRESFLTATSEHDLAAVSEPKLDALPDIRRGEPFSFEAIVEVRGEVEPENYKGMELTRRPLVVEEAEIDEAVEALRREHTELMPIEGRDVTARTDVLNIALEGTIEGEAIRRSELTIDLGEGEREPVPGLRNALTGVPLDVQDHPVELALPAQDGSDETRTAALTVSIVDARRKEIPEVDDDFAQDVERGETVAELRASLRADIEERKREQIDQEVREAALKELVARNQIPVASALVERGMEFRYRQLQAMLGMRPDQHDHGLPEDMREHLESAALEDIRGQLLLEAIADKEGLEVSDEGIDERLGEHAEQRDEPVARVRAEYERDGKLDNLRYQLRQEKVLDLLIEHAVITEAEPEPDPTEQAEAGDDDAQTAPPKEAADADAPASEGASQGPDQP